jgi:hypothetical protein
VGDALTALCPEAETLESHFNASFGGEAFYGEKPYQDKPLAVEEHKANRHTKTGDPFQILLEIHCLLSSWQAMPSTLHRHPSSE